MTRTRALTLAALGFVAALSATLLVADRPRAQEPLTPSPFLYAVRSDFFLGLGRGDMVRLERGMKFCETTLAAEPNHAEALVWHGAGLAYLAGVAMNAKDMIKARDLVEQAIKEMDRAVALAPNYMFVVVPRASALSAVANRWPDRARAQTMLQEAAAGFEMAYAVERPVFDRLSVHRRGEMLAGLAETYWRLGDKDKSREYLQLITRELPDTPYQSRAQAWLEEGSSAGRLSCLTCHKESAHLETAPARPPA
jgi:tetratricopeptide (TPR) repeat protein